MDCNRWTYEECVSELNKIVDPTENRVFAIPQIEEISNQMSRVLSQKELPILYRYMPISINSILGVMNEDVYMPSALSLNDVFEGAAYGLLSSREIDETKSKEMQGDIYIKAFSCKPNDNLMWSYYADSHKGICIGYDFSKVQSDIVKHLYPVQYSNDRFVDLLVQNIESCPVLYLRKSKCWEHEKEFRLIYTKVELEEAKNIALNCITEIQFGLRTKLDHKKLISKIVREKNKSIQIKETILNDCKFELETRPWEG